MSPVIDFWKKKNHQSSKVKIFWFVSFQKKKRARVESNLHKRNFLSEGGKSRGID